MQSINNITQDDSDSKTNNLLINIIDGSQIIELLVAKIFIFNNKEIINKLVCPIADKLLGFNLSQLASTCLLQYLNDNIDQIIINGNNLIKNNIDSIIDHINYDNYLSLYKDTKANILKIINQDFNSKEDSTVCLSNNYSIQGQSALTGESTLLANDHEF